MRLTFLPIQGIMEEIKNGEKGMLNDLLSLGEDVGNFFLGIFGDNAYIVGFIISMIPLIEMKGSILFMIGITKNYWLSMLFGFLGTSALAPLLLWLFEPVINWMKSTRLFKKLANYVEKHFLKKSEQLKNKANQKAENSKSPLTEEEKEKEIEFAKLFGLFVFTAIPLPMTGCWTASIVATILKLDYKKSLVAIVAGNIITALCITLLGGVLDIAFFR